MAYFSKKLRPVERRYSDTDREAVAIVLACRQFNSYLWGTRFTIRTDHQPVVSVFKHRTKSPRMNRWILEMRDYQYQIEYKEGRKNVVADHLNRPVRIIQNNEEQWLGKSKEELIEMQRRERRWNEVVEYLRGGRVPRSRFPRATIDQFTLEDGTILYVLVVPQELRQAAMQYIHDKESGHLGQHKTILKAVEYFY